MKYHIVPVTVVADMAGIKVCPGDARIIPYVRPVVAAVTGVVAPVVKVQVPD